MVRTPERRAQTILLAAAFFCCATMAAPAVSQQTPATPPTQSKNAAAATADALIRAALELRRKGNDAAALDKLLRALKLDPTPRAKAQVAMAQQALGHWLEAEKYMLQALATPQDRWISSRLEVLRNALATVREKLGLLQVAGVPDGATIYVAGAKVGEAPLKRSIRVVAGTIAIRVEAPGHRTHLGTVEVEPGLLNRHLVTMIPLKTNPEPKPADETP